MTTEHDLAQWGATKTTPALNRMFAIRGLSTKPLIGLRVEIPVHLDTWMRGARFGTVTGFRHGRDGQSDCLLVKMDHPGIKRRVRVWRLDWDYMRIVG